jgi:methionyl-tRNA formyltransferase
MRIVFMGTPEFAVASLKLLIASGYSPVAVVTGPDRPAGRGQHLAGSAVKAFADAQRLPILQPESLADPQFIAAVAALEPDLFIVVAFRILPPELFRLPRLGAFNLHASLLPKYRGAAPIQWAIIRGERETGVTTFFLKERVDTGNILLQARIPIGGDETAGELHDRLAEVGAEIVVHTARLIEQGKVNERSQDDRQATSAPKITKEHCRIDWKRPAAEIHNLIRGLSPRPCAFTAFGGTAIRVYRSSIAAGSDGASPGRVLASDRRLVVAAAAGAVEILELQQEGRNRMSAEEFLRGFAFPANGVLA